MTTPTARELAEAAARAPRIPNRVSARELAEAAARAPRILPRMSAKEHVKRAVARDAAWSELRTQVEAAEQLAGKEAALAAAKRDAPQWLATADDAAAWATLRGQVEAAEQAAAQRAMPPEDSPKPHKPLLSDWKASPVLRRIFRANQKAVKGIVGLAGFLASVAIIWTFIAQVHW